MEGLTILVIAIVALFVIYSDKAIVSTTTEPIKPVSREDHIEHMENKRDRVAEIFKDSIAKDKILENYNKNIENASLVFDYPEIKKRVLFHGACMTCETPSELGIGECRGCSYMTFNNDLPSLHSKP